MLIQMNIKVTTVYRGVMNRVWSGPKWYYSHVRLSQQVIASGEVWYLVEKEQYMKWKWAFPIWTETSLTNDTVRVAKY